MTATTTNGLPLWKKLLFSGILLVLVIGVLEVVAGVYLRFTRGYDGDHLYQYQYDPYKNILPTPGFVDARGIQHNGQGFRRSEDVPIAKAAGALRIFLMGGSTAYGLGGLWPHIQREFAVLDNQQTIDAYLEDILQTAFPDVQVEVINAAITSTWTHHSLIYLNQAILRYDPDMVLFLDGFNDFYFTGPDHDQFASYSYNLPSRVIMGDPTMGSLLYANGWWWFRKSALVHVAGRALRSLKLVLNRPAAPPPIDVEKSLQGLREVFPRNALAMHRRIGLILNDADIVPVFMLQPMLILEREKPMPDMERQLFEFNVESYRPNYEDFIHPARDTVAAYERAMVAEIGAEFIDLTSIYRDVPEQVYTDYAHLTPLGNELLATHVAEDIIPLLEARLARRTADVGSP